MRYRCGCGCVGCFCWSSVPGLCVGCFCCNAIFGPMHRVYIGEGAPLYHPAKAKAAFRKKFWKFFLFFIFSKKYLDISSFFIFLIFYAINI